MGELNQWPEITWLVMGQAESYPTSNPAPSGPAVSPHRTPLLFCTTSLTKYEVNNYPEGAGFSFRKQAALKSSNCPPKLVK